MTTSLPNRSPAQPRTGVAATSNTKTRRAAGAAATESPAVVVTAKSQVTVATPAQAAASVGGRQSKEDLELQEKITAYLVDLPVVALRKMTVRVSEQVAVLDGLVAFDYERQLAQHYVRRVSGVTSLINNVAVEPPPPPTPTIFSRAREKVVNRIPKFLRRSDLEMLENDKANSRFRPTGPVRSRLTHPLSFAGVMLGLMLIGVSTALSGTTTDLVSERLPTFAAKGSIMVGKEPPKGAFVVFHPVSGSSTSPHPAGYVNKFGSFSLTTYDSGDGAPAGDYVVTIEWRKAGGKAERGQLPNALPAKLSSPKTSTLRAHVNSCSTTIAPIQL